MNTEQTLELTLSTPAELTGKDKKGLIAYAEQFVTDRAAEGLDNLNVMAAAARYELFFKEVKDNAKLATLSEVNQYGKAGLSRLGVSMVAKETGASYDYSANQEWRELSRVVNEATALRKQLEEFLRSLPYEGRIVMDEATGEEYRAYPPAKTASQSVQLTIK